MIYLTEDDVRQRLTIADAIRLVEEAFRQLAAGAADNIPRSRCRAPGFILHSMSAAAGYLGLAGWKNYATTKAGAKFHVGLYDTATGTLQALIEADRLGQRRTGAVTGVAVRYLSSPEVDRVGMFGSGWQAQAQLAAVAAVRPIRQAVVYSRNAERRQAFAQQMAQELNIEVVAADEPQQAAADMPIVITATSSQQPVLQADWLAPGTLVAAMGSNWLEKSELDVATVAQATRVVCDDIVCCQKEAGDLHQAAEQGAFDWAVAENLAAVVAEGASPPSGQGGLCIFKSVGMAIEDVAVAAWVARKELRAAGVALPPLGPGDE